MCICCMCMNILVCVCDVLVDLMFHVPEYLHILDICVYSWCLLSLSSTCCSKLDLSMYTSAPICLPTYPSTCLSIYVLVHG